MHDEPIIVGIAGASGIPYALQLIRSLSAAKQPLILLVTRAAREVFRLEMNMTLPDELDACKAWFVEHCHCDPERLQLFGEKEWTSVVASGSGCPNRMVICPASSSCVAAIAHGMSDNLLERAADVVLKEKGQLIVVHRETPLSVIHLENLLSLARAGATILPASPGFYQQPKSIEDLVNFIVARILKQLKILQDLVPAWGVIDVAI